MLITEIDLKKVNLAFLVALKPQHRRNIIARSGILSGAQKSRWRSAA